MAATESPQPAPATQSDGYESYCLWPNDTLSLIAHNAQVSEEATLAANPGWTGHAGRTLRLPPGSVPPSQWTTSLPPVARVEDLPFGISGYYLGRDNRQKRVALSFDMGYAVGNKALKEMLAARGISATFFVLGGALVRHPYIIGQILDNGHELGNHSYTHDNMLHMSERVTTQACPGAIIAFHDVNPANAAALPRLLDFFERNEHQFVTVSEIMSP